MMLRRLQATAIWTAGLCALAGTVLIAAFLSSGKPQPHILTAAALAAATGLVSLLIGVAMVHVFATRRFESGTWLMQACFPGDEQAEREAARLRERLRILEKRLDIDEARLCSQYAIPCTCWSLCAGSPDWDSISAAASPARHELRNLLGPDTGQNGLPIVRRAGRDDCPFRFASPATRPARSDCGLPPGSGTAAPQR